MPESLLIYTIGHSDHAIEAFVALLRCHSITVVVDVRSQPYSQWTPQFNRETLARDLEPAGIAYRHMGDALGGRPSNLSLYVEGQERPDYQRLAQTPAFQAGIETLLYLAGKERAAVMCSEGDYRRCHRHLLIMPALLERGARVLHIQSDGTIVEARPEPRQLSLFA